MRTAAFSAAFVLISTAVQYEGSWAFDPESVPTAETVVEAAATASCPIGCSCVQQDDVRHLSCSNLGSICGKEAPGFVSSLDLKLRTYEMADLECLRKLQNLTTLKIDFSFASAPRNLLSHLIPTSLHELSLGNVSLPPDSSSSRFPSLRHLAISNCGLTNVEVFRSIFSSSPLEILDISSNPVSVAGFCAVTGMLTNVRELRAANSSLVGRLPVGCLKEGLEVVDLSENPLLDLAETSFPSTLRDVRLRDGGVETLPRNVFDLPNLSSVDLSENSLLCDCRSFPLKESVGARNITVVGLRCKTGEVGLGQLERRHELLNCTPVTFNLTEDNGPVRSGEVANLTCNPGGSNPEASVTWVTPKNVVLHWLAPGNDSMFASHPKLHLDTLLPPAGESDYADKLKLEDSGRRLVVYSFSRYDVGVYQCFVDNGFSNVSHNFRVHMHHENMFDLELSSIIIGATFSVSFLLLVLIIQLARMMVYRWGCCCSDTISPRARRVGKMLQALEAYRCQQIEWLRESYSMQRQRVVDNCAQQMERIRESYSGQMQNLRDFRDYGSHQIGSMKDSYHDQVKRLRDYSAQQMSWVNESYIQGRRRVHRYTAQQMVRLRETYKIQQKTLNKIMENLPDMRLDACRTRDDAEGGAGEDEDDDLVLDVAEDLRFLDQIVLAEPDGVVDDDYDAEEDGSSRYYTPPDGGSPERQLPPPPTCVALVRTAAEANNMLRVTTVIEDNATSLPVVIVERPVRRGDDDDDDGVREEAGKEKGKEGDVSSADTDREV